MTTTLHSSSPSSPIPNPYINPDRFSSFLADSVNMALTLPSPPSPSPSQTLKTLDQDHDHDDESNNSAITQPPQSSLPQNPNPKPQSLPTLLHLSFNQDSGCFAVGTDRGFRCYSTDPFREVFRQDFDSDSGPGGIGTGLFRWIFI